MIRKYYEFDLSKESLLSIEQDIFLAKDKNNFTCITGIYKDVSIITSFGNSIVKLQDGIPIVLGLSYKDLDGQRVKKDLVGFMVEMLFSDKLEGEYYECFEL